MYIAGKGDFTDLQKAILEYVESYDDGYNLVNERLIKERIIQYLTANGKGSRKTILRDINTLEAEGVVYFYREKPNSQTHYVHKSKDSILLLVIDDLHRLKNAFFALIDETSNTIAEMMEKMKGQNIPATPETLRPLIDIYESLWILFQHFIAVYILNCTVVWPKKVSDRKMLDRLYSLTFDTVKEIELRLSEIVFRWQLEYLRRRYIRDTFVLKGDKLYDIIRCFQQVGLNKYADDLLDILWKVGHDFVPDAFFHAPKYMQALKDWRNALKWKDIFT
jgi:hypothetical protein